MSTSNVRELAALRRREGKLRQQMAWERGEKRAVVAQQIEETTKPDETDKPEEPDTTNPADVNPDAPGIIVGKVEDIRTAVKGGESYYYIRLEGSEAYYSISASDDENVVILNKGDTVTINFSGNGAILKADSLKIN